MADNQDEASKKVEDETMAPEEDANDEVGDCFTTASQYIYIDRWHRRRSQQ